MAIAGAEHGWSYAVGYNGAFPRVRRIFCLTCLPLRAISRCFWPAGALVNTSASIFSIRLFKGLYQVNAFDMALLIPYFIVLMLLASYGMHRYVLVYLYYKHRKNRTTDPPGALPNCRGSRCSCRFSTSSL